MEDSESGIEQHETIRENNAALKHKYELGAVVDVDVEIWQPGYADTEVTLKGTCRLIVVGHIRDSDKTPMYILSDLPVRYPVEGEFFSRQVLVYNYLAALVQSGYEEARLRPTGMLVPIRRTVTEWLKAQED